VSAGGNREHRRGPFEEPVFGALRLVFEQTSGPLEPASGHRYPQPGAEPDRQHYCHHRGPGDVALIDQGSVRTLANGERFERMPCPKQRVGEHVEVVAAQAAVAVGYRQVLEGVLPVPFCGGRPTPGSRLFAGYARSRSCRHRVRDGGRFEWRPVQIGSLLEDRLLQAGYRWAGFDPQLLDERVAQLAVGAQSIGLPAIAIQGDHELARQALPERVLTHQLGQLTHDGVVLAER
jgi:hypothetical protein